MFPDATPQVWEPPAAMELQFRPPATAVGVGRLLLKLPDPSAPLLFAPQQVAPPPVRIPQVWPPPAEIAV